MCGGQLNSFPQCPLGPDRLWRPAGAVPRPAQRTVRRSAHAPTGLAYRYLPRGPLIEKSRPGPDGLRTGIHHQNTGVRKKKSKEILNPWQPPAHPASLTSRTARRERGAGPYTFFFGRSSSHQRICGKSSPRRTKHRRGRAPRQRAPGARILLLFHLIHTGCVGFPAHQQAHSPQVPRTAPWFTPWFTPAGPIRHLRGLDRPPPVRREPIPPPAPQSTVRGSIGRPSAVSLIWISVPIVGHTPQS